MSRQKNQPATWPTQAAPNWLIHCRPGMESASAAEMEQRAQAQGLLGTYAIARPGSAYLRICQPDPEQASKMVIDAPRRIIFPRQLVHEWCWLEGLPQQDRLDPILDQLPADQDFSGIQLSSPDSDHGKGLQRFLNGFQRALERGLDQRGIRWQQAGTPRLHLFFPDSGQVSIGFDQDPNSPPGGILRLRMPRAAPSRSTLKVEEALLRLMSEQERSDTLQAGMIAADLGAAPGGWTWQMVRRHLRVIAVDNGPMDPALMDSGLVSHLKQDAFTWKPTQATDWLLCDIVDKPSRVMDRIGLWLEQGWTRHALFNLKLPMKQPWPVVRDLLDGLNYRLETAGIGAEIRARQLYHDREEITVLVLGGRC